MLTGTIPASRLTIPENSAGARLCMVSRVDLYRCIQRKGMGMTLGDRSEGGRDSRPEGDGRFRRFPRLGWVAAAAVLALMAAGCSSSSSSSTSTPAASSSATGSATVPAVNIDSFTVNITPTMSQFKALAAAGTKGANTLQVGVVLPDTTSSTRWVDFDAPYLKQAFTAAGFTPAQFRIDNAQGSDATQLNDATADINLGAKILIVCPLDGPTGVAIAKLAQQKGVTLIAYDRAIFEGTSTYYVSFDNEHVGELIGTGFTDCVKAWGVKSPKVYVLNGGQDTDPNAISFATGYNKVVWRSEEHTSELQSHVNLVCRLLLEKKKK